MKRLLRGLQMFLSSLIAINNICSHSKLFMSVSFAVKIKDNALPLQL